MMKVLIVEDNRVSRLVLVAYLEKMGYEVLQAEDGDQGIKIWKEEFPDIVLTDWNMPNTSGIDLIQYIRNACDQHYTYVIIITSRDEDSDLMKGFEVGVDDYLIKPVNRQELLMRMKAGERLLNLQSKEQLVFAMAKMVELRDQETGDHLERIRLYAKILSSNLSETVKYKTIIDGRFIKSIYDSSPLHDIGKMGVPDVILQKNGKLSPDEFRQMQDHTKIGVETLEAVSKNGKGTFLNMAIEIARSHHERWDGSGYPDRLLGEKIPLAARIVSLADVYDALRSKRVYKDAIAHETVVKMIEEESGKHFDPDIVASFVEIKDDFEKISQKY